MPWVKVTTGYGPDGRPITKTVWVAPRSASKPAPKKAGQSAAAAKAKAKAKAKAAAEKAKARAAAAAKKRAQQQAAKIAKARAAAAAKRAAALAAQREAKRIAAERAKAAEFYQRQLAEQRRNAYEKLKTQQVDKVKRAGLIKPKKPVGRGSGGNYGSASDDAAWKAGKQAATYAAHTQQAKDAAKKRAEAQAYEFEKQRLIGTSFQPIAPGVPVMRQTGGVKTADDARSAERLLAEEVERAKRGQGSTPDYIKKLSEQYDRYASTVAQEVFDAQDELNKLLEDAEKGDRGDAKWKRAVKFYEEQYQPLLDEYNRLFVGDETTKDGSYRQFEVARDQIALQQREWWKNQTRQALQSKVNQLSNVDPRWNEDVSEELAEAKKLLAIMEGKPQALGQVLDRYEYRNGTVVPIYRQATVEEALARVEAERRAEEARIWNEQRKKEIAKRTFAMKHGLVQSASGRWVSKEDAQAERDLFRDMKELWGDSPPDIKRREDMVEAVNLLMERWDKRNAREGNNFGSGVQQQEAAGWRAKRQKYEDYLYALFGGEAPGALEDVISVPGVSHGLAALQTLNSAAGGFMRIMEFITTGGDSSKAFGFNPTVADVPDAVKKDAIEFARKGTSNDRLAYQRAYEDFIRRWLASAAGQRWVEQETKLRRAQGVDDVRRFYEDFNEGEDIGTMVAALNEFGSQPFQNDAGNLLFQLLADPVNAVPLKATTWLARGRYASSVSKGSKANPLKWARGIKDWATVDEGLLKLREQLAKDVEVLRGDKAGEFVEQLRKNLVGIRSQDEAAKAVEDALTRIGVNPRDPSVAQIGNIVEGMVTKAVRTAAPERFTTRTEELAKKMEDAKRVREEAAAARRKAEGEARVARDEAIERSLGPGREAERALSAEKVAREKELAEKVATERAKAGARPPAERAAADLVAGRGAGAERGATGTPPATADTATVAATPGPREPRLQRAHSRDVARVRRSENYQAFQPEDEYYMTNKLGQRMPRDAAFNREFLRQAGVKSKDYDALMKAAVGGDAKAQRKLFRLHDQMVNAWRTMKEDLPTIEQSKFLPTEWDLFHRAGVLGDEAAQETIRKNRQTLQHLVRSKARGASDEYIRGFRQEVKLGDDEQLIEAGRIGTEGKVEDVDALEDVSKIGGKSGYTDSFDTGQDLLEARNTARQMHDLYVPFTHHSLSRYTALPGRRSSVVALLQKLARPSYVKWLTNSRFGDLIMRLDGDDFIAYGPAGWRDGGQVIFEVFHQLRRSDPKKLADMSMFVNELLEELPDNIFLRMWKVMEYRAGMPWADDLAEVEAGFLDAAYRAGLEPRLALASVPNGYFAPAPPKYFGLSPVLQGMWDHDDWLPAPPNWSRKKALDTITSIFTRNVGEPMQVVHYVATKYGDFVKGIPFFRRTMGELTHAALLEMGVDELVEVIVKNISERSTLGQMVTRRAEELGLSFDEALGYGVDEEFLRAVAKADTGSGLLPRDIIRGELEASLKKFANLSKSPLRPDYRDLTYEIHAAYWRGDLRFSNPRIHDFMYLMRMQGSGTRDALVRPTMRYLDYMDSIGQLDHAQQFLQRIHHREFFALEVRYRATRSGLGYRDPLTGELHRVTDTPEWEMWRRMGFEPDDAKLEAQTKFIEEHRARVDAEEAENAERQQWMAEEREMPSDSYTGTVGAAQLEDLALAIEKAEDAKELWGTVTSIVRRLADSGGAGMTVEEVEILTRAMDNLRNKPGVTSLMRRLTDWVFEGALDSSLRNADEILAHKEAVLRVRMELMRESPPRTRVLDKHGKARVQTPYGASPVKAPFVKVYAELEKELQKLLEIRHGKGRQVFETVDPLDSSAKSFVRRGPTRRGDAPDKDRLTGLTRDDFIKQYDDLAKRVYAAEKNDLDPSEWTPEMRTAYESGDWKTFSRLRGYTEHEIAEYERFLSFHEGVSAEDLELAIMLDDAGSQIADAGRLFDARQKYIPPSDDPLVQRYERAAEVDGVPAAVAEVSDEVPPEVTIPPVFYDEDAAVRAAHYAELLHRISGMSEEQYLRFAKEEAYRLLRVAKTRKVAPGRVRAARKRIRDIELAEFARRWDKGRETAIGWESRARHRDKVVKAVGEDAKGYISPKQIAPFARDGYEALVEQTRTYWNRLLRAPAENASSRVRVLGRRGRAAKTDYMPMSVFEKVEQEVADAIAEALGYRAKTVTAKRGRAPDADPERLSEELAASRLSDKDPLVLQAKLRVLNKYGIHLDAYDEARAVLRRGYVQRRVNRWLQARTDAVVAEAKRLGVKDPDWEKAYLALRKERAEEEAIRQLGSLAFGEMHGVEPSVILEEFIARWSDDGTLRTVVEPPLSAFQRKTLQEAIKLHAEVDDISDVAGIHRFLGSANRPPFEEGREAVRDWLVRHGMWSPRKAEDFTLGKRSWSVQEEAQYWLSNFGEVPPWADMGQLAGKLNEIFHDAELYYLQMRSWGVINRSMDLKLRVDGTDAKALEKARIEGDPELGIPARRELEEQRRFVVERYGELVGHASGGGVKLTAMPWLMYPDEIAEYLARRASNGLPPELIGSTEELEKLVRLIEEEMDPLVKRMLDETQGPITFVDVYHVVAEVQARILADPTWNRRWRDLVGQGLDVWTGLARWAIFSNPAFMTMNVIDVPIKTAWYRMTRRGLFNPGLRDIPDDAYRRAQALTPESTGLDAQSTIYSYRERAASDYWKNPRAATITVGKKTLRSKRLGQVLDRAQAPFRLIPETASKAEMAGKMRLAREMYPQVYTEALAKFGDAEVADLWARNFIKKEVARMWPTAGTGPYEQLFNRIVPFASYMVKNRILFLSEAVAHPAILNKIDYIGRAVERENLKNWEEDHPGTEMPEHLRRLVPLPWGGFIDLSQFSDASRGLKPLYEAAEPRRLVDVVSDWVRVINPSQQAAIYWLTNSLGLTTRTMYVPVLDEAGYPTGRYEKVERGWTEPWSNREPDLGSVFWAAQAVESFSGFVQDGTFTVGEMSQLLGQVFFFNAIKSYDKNVVNFQFYRSLYNRDRGAAEAWLIGTPEGRELEAWLIEKKGEPREVKNALKDLVRGSVDPNAWFSLTKAEQDAVKAGRARIAVLRSIYAARIAQAGFGTQAAREAKAEMYFLINQEYLNNPALLKSEVLVMTPKEWSERTSEWQTDKLVDDFFRLTDQRPSRASYKTSAEYRKAVEAWELSKRMFLKQYPQVERVLAGSIAQLDAARDEQNRIWDETFKRIDDRAEAIKAAEQDIAKFGRDSERGRDAQERLDILYLQNEMDFLRLERDTAVEYFQYEDFAKTPFGQALSPDERRVLKTGITMPRVAVLNDLDLARYRKAEREGTLDAFIASEAYNKQMRDAVNYAKGGKPLGAFDGRRWGEYMDKHPEFREKYFDANPGKEQAFKQAAFYANGMKAVIAKAKAGGSFDPAVFVRELKKNPALLAEYFRRNPGKREQWARNDAYIKHISVWGKLASQGRWDEANAVWERLPKWVKDRYLAKNPRRAKSAAQTSEYMGYMQRWVDLFDSKGTDAAMDYFRSLPQWAKDRYYAKHPDKKAQYETSQKMFEKLKNYFASDTKEGQSRYLEENPDLAKWMAKNASTAQAKKFAILAAYREIPKEEAWLRRIFREKYPEVFSAEALGEKKLERVYRTLLAHPEASPAFERWVEAIWASYAEMQKYAKPRPLNTYFEVDRKTPARKFRKSYSAAETSK